MDELELDALAAVVGIIDDACHRAREYPYNPARRALADAQIAAHDALRAALVEQIDSPNVGAARWAPAEEHQRSDSYRSHRCHEHR